MGGCVDATREKGGGIQMDLQGEACSRRKRGEVQGVLRGEGISQKEGIDYEETFTLVARYFSIRTIISPAAEMGWRVHQMDFKNAFLNGVIKEEVYILQPEGFDVENREMHVCKLHRSL